MQRACGALEQQSIPCTLPYGKVCVRTIGRAPQATCAGSRLGGSAQVFQVLLEFVDEEHLEKASIDEAFLDMTEIVERRLAECVGCSSAGLAPR